MIKKWGLTRKLLFYFLIVSILPLFGVSYFAYIVGRQTIVEETLKNLSSTLVLREAEIDRWIFDTTVNFEDITDRFYFGEKVEKILAYHNPLPGKELAFYILPVAHNAAHEEIVHILKNSDTLSSLNFFELFILDKNGEVHISTDPSQELKHKEDRIYYQEGLKKTTLQPFYYSLTHKEPAITIAMPIRNKNNTVTGVLAGRMRLERVSRIMEERTGLGASGETYLVNEFHFLVSSTRYGYSLRQGLFTEGVDTCLKDHTSGTAFYKNYKGDLVIGAYRWISKYNVCMIAEIAQSEAFTSVERFRNLSTLFGITVFLMISILGVMIARSLINPIRILQAGANAIGLGNLDYRFILKTSDEFGDLASEFDKMRIRLKEVKNRDDALSRLKSEFVSIAAHQLRTPISGIKWALNALLHKEIGAITKRQEKYIRTLYQNNERMITLVGDLLDVVKLEEGKFGFVKNLTDLIVMVERIITELTRIAKEKNINFKFEKPKGKIPLTFIDEEKIRMALFNIIENALFYTHPGGTVTVRVNEDGHGNIGIFVTDNGIGISKEKLSHVFEKFSRGDEAIRMNPSGSGFGLYIAKNIIDYSGGTIKIVSEQKKGTVLKILLPIADAKEVASTDVSASQEKA